MRIVSIYKYCKLVLELVSIILMTGMFTSCTEVVDPTAANSLSAIIAVIGEYLYATIVLVFIVILWILRPAGVALVILSILELCKFIDLSINYLLLMCIGILMFLTSFIPIKQYEPMVVISKHFKIPKKDKVKENHKGYKDFFIQLIVGIILLIIEYSIFSR